MGNTDDNNKSRKCRSKIRIKLTDPNIPDSYVCEIFESSLEDEEEISEIVETEETSKPKNYFEVLMSKNLKKGSPIIVSKETTSDVEKKVSEKNRSGKNKKKTSLTQPVNSKGEKRKLESESSEDESLLQIQRKAKSKSFNEQDDDCIITIIHETTKHEKADSKDVLTLLKSSKVNLSQKKSFNILNYFSKSEVSLKKAKFDEEITSVQKSVKNSQPPKSIKSKEVIHGDQKILLNGINKENVKLAPLFYKKENPVLDAAQQKARLDFLYKSSSSVVKKSNNKISDVCFNFPKVSHVQQRNDNVCWSQRDVCLPLRQVCTSDDSGFHSNKKFNFKIEHSTTINNIIDNNIIKLNKRLFEQAKCKYVELNLNLVIDGLREKSEKFLAHVKEIEKCASKKKSTDEINYEELNILWTEKYKPKSSEILGNENVVKKCRKWLESWKSFDEELKALVKSSRSLEKKKETNAESDDDFWSSEDEDFGLKAPTNVCFISGPNGCGKTALVYALASELEFGILELNASSKRTGKKVLTDLQEATQSHKVHRINLPQIDTSQVKKTKNKKRKRKKKAVDQKRILDQANDSKISLILIEDADIIFDEHDEGFISAITTLVQTSKRPLIFLSNVPDCHCLYNFKMEQCLVLRMEPPNINQSCAVLDIVTQLEGACFDRKFLESVVCHNNFDLRKSLLQLQFWIHSNQTPVDFEKYFDLGRLWWGLSLFLYKQEIKHVKIPKSRKSIKVNDLFDSSDDEIETTAKDSDNSTKCFPVKTSSVSRTSDPSIESHFRVLDAASILDTFRLPGSSEPILWSDYKPKDSLSLDESMDDLFCVRDRLTEQLSNELVSLSSEIFTKKVKENDNEVRVLSYLPPSWEEIRWRNSFEKASEELSVVIPLHRGRDERSLHVDYLPILRNICRIEKNRLEINPKRKNRFYHYLNNLGFELTDENLEINCSVFSQ